MVVVLLLAIALVAWSLHLMQQALSNKEFSLMLAGTLVASAAAALVVVYFLGNSSLRYLLSVDRNAYTTYNAPVTANESFASVRQATVLADWNRLVEPLE
jgi:ABC-type Fe3+-siderophore transport system permease subunit